MYTHKCGNISWQDCHAKGSRKDTKTQEFMFRDTTNVEREMYDYTSNNWNHRNSNKSKKKKDLEAIPGKHSIDSLQQTAVLGTSHIIREVLQSETSSLSGGDLCWFKRSTREKRRVTRDNEIIIIITIITRSDYTHWHSKVANNIHQELAIKFGLSKGEPTTYYKYEPQSVLESLWPVHNNWSDCP
jgi:hypothetical protein